MPVYVLGDRPVRRPDDVHTLKISPVHEERRPWDGGRQRWSYELLRGDQLIFQGADLGSPPGRSADEIALHALIFLTLEPGDTDPEYFAGYTPEQREWCEQYAADLAMYTYDEYGTERRDLADFRIGQ
ncbi:hypothetical protein LG943_12705 [Streptomonospora sp. S1-112]|uniref:Uncharacterized protein n=1 Tax=Streptomonospora mangrovi TaxID=2883123 RepID=A0A9X3SHE1_9ACTN|nr:hypothetical protein [Streptomonospora mangrovi]MDA0565169.1 hypothetical protein [Streptomonospora mangrovi]